MMKRYIALVLCLLLALAAGCVKEKPETQPSASEDVVPAESEVTETQIVPVAPDSQNASETQPPQNAQPEQGGKADEPAPQAGGSLSFESVTLDGQPIDSSIYQNYDLVMLNCWAEWCGPCVGEMPELERIHQEFPNVLLLGVLSFSNDPESAKQTVRDTGVTYPVFEPTGALLDRVNTFEAIPTTMFLDRNGVEITEPVVGSQSYEDWKTIVQNLLLVETDASDVEDEPAAPSAEGLTFEAVTLDGQPIDSSIFANYDLIILNCWAEWCGPCVGEMPELERIHQEYPNVLLLGVLSFSNDLDSAKQTVRDTGVTYPVFEPTGALLARVNTFDAIPTTLFLNSQGVEILEPVVGSQSYEDWKTIIEALLP